MNHREKVNRKKLKDLGVADPIHQKVLLERLPSRTTSVRKAWNELSDVTNPLARPFIVWKESLRVLRQVEEERRQENER